jgi:hypothetical protein
MTAQPTPRQVRVQQLPVACRVGGLGRLPLQAVASEAAA